jgi:hypothetical protein
MFVFTENGIVPLEEGINLQRSLENPLPLGSSLLPILCVHLLQESVWKEESITVAETATI